MTPLARQRRRVAELAARCEQDRRAMDQATGALAESVRRSLLSPRGLLAGIAGAGTVAALLSRAGRRLWPVAGLATQALPALALWLGSEARSEARAKPDPARRTR